MADVIPEDLLNKLNAAQTLLDAALAKDDDLASATRAADAASQAEEGAHDAAMKAHQDAGASAAEALAAVRAHFGL